ncbi:MAG: YbaK/EbsC family protein [Gemmatimonadota bacterium]|nr:MAG: YbaK/EbsC family protein [Gemmatimonadota bacterium]
MAMTKLKAYLDENKVRYLTITHSPAYTSQKTAASAHVPGKELAKTVIVKVDGQLAMAVLPGSYQVDFGQLKEVVGASKVELASEDDFRDTFSDCEVGAMPPFGNLYNMPVYVAEALTEDEEIAFNACSHTELIRMSYEDFSRLVQPTVVKFAATSRV